MNLSGDSDGFVTTKANMINVIEKEQHLEGNHEELILNHTVT